MWGGESRGLSCLGVAVRHQGRTVELVVGRIAAASHGVVTRAGLLGAGVTKAEIRQRLRTGALLREYPGVYRVGHRAPSVEARYLAAVWACGEGAVLTGLAAAHVLVVLKGPAPPPEVTTPTERRVKGLKTHRSRHIDPEDITTWRGIPITTVPRTLVDLAAVLSVDDLARACHEAEVRHRTTPAAVEAVLARRPKSPGAAMLAKSCGATSTSSSAGSRPASSPASVPRAFPSRKRTAPPVGGASTAAGLRTD